MMKLVHVLLLLLFAVMTSPSWAQTLNNQLPDMSKANRAPGPAARLVIKEEKPIISLAPQSPLVPQAPQSPAQRVQRLAKNLDEVPTRVHGTKRLQF